MFLEQYQLDALYKNTELKASSWTGGVHCIDRFREVVPFMTQKGRYVVEFIYPYFFQGNEFYKEMLYPTKDGGYIIPKRAHRLVEISAVDDNGGLSNVEPLGNAEIDPFGNGLMHAIMKYLREYPQTNQFFSRFMNDKMKEFCNQIISKRLPKAYEGYEVEIYHDLGGSNYGFQIHRK